MRIQAKRIIVLGGLSRAGNHLITNWFGHLCEGPTLYFNNAPLPHDREITLHPSQMGSAEIYWYKHPDFDDICVRDDDRYRAVWGGSDEDIIVDTLMISFENHTIDKLGELTFAESIQHEEAYLLLVVRDFINWAASCFKRGGRDFVKKQSETWINHAYQAVLPREKRPALKGFTASTIDVIYNYFVIDEEYREFIASQLDISEDELSFNLDLAEEAMDQVQNIGGGSSFDGLEMDGKGSEMQVLQRYEAFLDNKEFTDLYDTYDEVRVRYNQLFGPPPEGFRQD